MNTSLSKLLSLIFRQYNKKSFTIDVGAHYGEFTKYLISTCFFSHIVSFEPNPKSYAKLLGQISSTDNCVFEEVNYALSHQSELLDLYCDDDTATVSLLKYDSTYLGHGQINAHSVLVITLDDYLDKHSNFGLLQLLKIDTQGNDLSVIKGGGGGQLRRIVRLFKLNSYMFLFIKGNVLLQSYQKPSLNWGMKCI